MSKAVVVGGGIIGLSTAYLFKGVWMGCRR